MRKFISLVFFFVCCTIIAQSATYPHKQGMIDHINAGEYSLAEKELNLVENWGFVVEEDFGKLDFQKAISFIEDIDSTKLAEGVQDSLVLYLAEHAYFYGKFFMMKGQYEAASTYLVVVANIKKQYKGETHPEFADALLDIAMLCKAIGYVSDAERNLLQVAEIYRNAFGEVSEKYANAMNGLGLLYEETGDYPRAEQCLLKAFSICQNLFGDDYNRYPAIINNLGLLYMSLGNLQQAEQYLLQAAEILEQLNHSQFDLANTYSNLGSLYMNKNDYDKAELYFTKSLNATSFMGDESADYIQYLSHMAALYKERLDYDKCFEMYQRGVEMAEKIYGIQTPDYADILRNLGIACVSLGKYDMAEQYLSQAKELFQSIYGSEHKMVAKCLSNLGWVSQMRQQYQQAESYYKAAHAIYTNLADSRDKYICIAQMLSRFGSLYNLKGQHQTAKKYNMDALQIYATVLEDDDPLVVEALCDLGWIEVKLGDYQQAEQHLLQGLQAQRQRYGELSNPYAVLLRMTGSFYITIGDYEKAEQFLQKAFEVTAVISGTQTLSYATCWSHFGALRLYAGRYQEAEQAILQAIAIEQSIYGEDYLGNAADLNNLGTIYANIGDLKKAKYYLTVSNQKHQKGIGKQDYFQCLYFNNMGFAHLRNGKYKKAIQYLLKAEEIISSSGNFDPVNRAKTLNKLGLAYEGKKDVKKAEFYYLLADSILRHRYRQTLSFMSERQRSSYWQMIEKSYSETYSPFVYRSYTRKPSLAAFAYNNELFTKGLLLSSTTIIQQSILAGNDTVLIREWSELENLRLLIASLEQNQSCDEIASYEHQAEQLEKVITQKSAIYRESQAMWSITWESVRDQLNTHDVAIEFMTVPTETATIYCALLIRKNSTYPNLIPLFEEKELLALVNTSTEGKTNGTYSVDGNGKTLQQLVWSKVLPHVKQGETIYFAPSGVLHQVAIEALPFDETHTMGDKFNLVRLSSTREIVLNKMNDTHSTASLYGGIHYDVDSTTIASESRKYEDVAVSRRIENDTLDRGNVRYLPGTKEEVESINQMLQDNYLSVQLFTMTSANEESFKAISGTHQNILHIATHGFYWSDSTAQKKDYFSQRAQRMDDNQPTLPALDPLNRCGLLFAGANTALSGHSADLPEGVQDGILTAKEISLLDLRDADLVVLSACETGKGEITGEGVFGLQRAFKQSGAQTIIMSLWPVNDAATQLLMTEFYRNWITNRQPKREAFRNAQNTVRTQFEEPVYWAGFIMLD